jgi:hypothetical protein
MLDSSPGLPFAWTRVVAHGDFSGTIRVRITCPTTESLALDIADQTGRLVMSVGSVVSRPAPLNESLLRIAWNTIPVPAETSDIAIFECVTPGGDVPAAVRTLLGQVLAAVQSAEGKWT